MAALSQNILFMLVPCNLLMFVIPNGGFRVDCYLIQVTCNLLMFVIPNGGES